MLRAMHSITQSYITFNNEGSWQLCVPFLFDVTSYIA